MRFTETLRAVIRRSPVAQTMGRSDTNRRLSSQIETEHRIDKVIVDKQAAVTPVGRGREREGIFLQRVMPLFFCMVLAGDIPCPHCFCRYN